MTEKKPVIRRGMGAVAATTAILGLIYAAEGGYVNNKADRGGPTNHGVTLQVARESGYLGDMRDFPKHCYGRMTTCADKIYTQKYIHTPGFSPWLELDPAVAAEVVDTGVNMGPAVAARFLQTAINRVCIRSLTVDGKIGNKTVSTYEICQRAQGPQLFCTKMLAELDAQQEARYRGIVMRSPSQRVFLRGWIAHRINNVPRSACA